MENRSKLLERSSRVSEKGANRSKETREFRQRPEKFRGRRKPLERN